MKLRWIAGSIGIVVIGLVSPTLASASHLRAPAVFQAGSDGIGDPYFPLMGNGGYDVLSYKLDVSYDPTTNFLQGTATIRAKATQDLTQFHLDLQGLNVRSVVVRGSDAGWSRAGQHELVIAPAKPVREHTHFTTVVKYEGAPTTLTVPGTDSDPMGFIPTSGGALIAGQPEVAATWFPVNDHPLDKAEYTFIITVPAGLEAVANGRLMNEHTRHGLSTWRWHENDPMASYLATATMGQFRTESYRTRDGLRVYNAIDPSLYLQSSDPDDPNSPSLGQVAEDTFRRIPNQLRFLSSMFGPYPFDDAGGIVDDAPIRFALENQTRSIYAPHWFEDPFVARIVQIHELAHQWYGDSVSVHHWRDIWLNEGFATYSEWLWLAHVFDDPGVPQEIFDDLYSNISRQDPFWDVVIGDPGSDSLFDDPVYARGAMTLVALRERVGDDDFFQILRRWASSHALSNGSTPQFIRLAERISGSSLDALFNEWLFTGHKPSLSDGRMARVNGDTSPRAKRAVSNWYSYMTAKSEHQP